MGREIAAVLLSKCEDRKAFVKNCEPLVNPPETL